MRLPTWICTVLVILAVLVPRPVEVHAEDADEPIVEGKLGQALDRAVRRAGGEAFWGSVLVSRGGDILLAKGYGRADYKVRGNRPTTLHELASTSKQFTAAAILDLQERQKLEVTDTIDQVLPDVPRDKRTITIHHLLAHTSGLRGDIGVAYASPIERRPYLERVLTAPLAAAPGERFEYSNVGYAILAAIVEEVTHKPFEDYLETRIFEPAKMKDTGCIGARDLIQSGRASVRKTDEPGSWTSADWHWGWGYKGMGGVVSTVLDLHRWDRALRTDEVLDEETRAFMHTPVRGGYACGWRVDVTPRGTTKAHHSGSVAGYGVNYVRFLEDDACIAILSNDGRKAYEVTNACEALLFEPVPIEVSIDLKPLDRSSRRIYALPAPVTWKARKKGRAFLLELRSEGKPIVTLRAPRTYAKGMHANVAQAVAAREPEDATDGDEPTYEAGLYLQAFDPGLRKHELTQGVTVEIRPEYRGRDASGNPVIDKRVLLYLNDTVHRCWPLMVKMNVEAARELLTTLAKVTN